MPRREEQAVSGLPCAHKMTEILNCPLPLMSLSAPWWRQHEWRVPPPAVGLVDEIEDEDRRERDEHPEFHQDTAAIHRLAAGSAVEPVAEGVFPEWLSEEEAHQQVQRHLVGDKRPNRPHEPHQNVDHEVPARSCLSRSVHFRTISRIRLCD
jgi:hypothetical protein